MKNAKDWSLSVNRFQPDGRRTAVIPAKNSFKDRGFLKECGRLQVKRDENFPTPAHSGILA